MANVNIYDMADTWNNGATTFTAIKMNVTDTASAAGSLLIDLQVGSVSKAQAQKDGRLSALYVALGNTDANAPDVFLCRDAANTLALRNGVNVHAFRVYNTFTDASNYERGGFTWSGNFFRVETFAIGSGIKRPFVFSGSEMYFNFGVSDNTGWRINTSGHFIAGTDNTYDIGAAANRPRDIYCARDLFRPGGTQAIIRTSAAITSGAGASSGTLLNAPAVGNPTCWIPINDNGTTRYIPAW